ncbi:MAG: STAS domain-containing protein [Magnetospirillum sp. WYHS-4]
MDIREDKSGDTTTYRLGGRFTFADHAAFRTILGAVGGGGARQVVLDLGQLEFIDSAGMGMLLLGNDTAAKAGVALVLKGAQGQVQRLFVGQKFSAVFRIED